MSDNTPQNPGDTPSGNQSPTPPPSYDAPQYPPAPQYDAAPQYDTAPQYPAPPQYPAAPQYDTAPPYGSAPQQYPPPGPYGAAAPYPYAQQKTNTLAIVSLIASLVGIVGILPFIGSLVGVITGHMSLNQLKTSGEKGRGLALAGTIVGWVGLTFTIIIGIIIIFAIVYSAQNNTLYGT